MDNKNLFKQAYLRQLGIIKEDADTEAAETADVTKQICFTTNDQALIDAIDKGFEEIVFMVKAEGEDGEESVEEIKISKDSFGDIQVTDIEAETDEIEECGDEIEECGDEIEECGDEIEECGKNIFENDEDFIDEEDETDNI